MLMENFLNMRLRTIRRYECTTYLIGFLSVYVCDLFLLKRLVLFTNALLT